MPLMFDIPIKSKFLVFMLYSPKYDLSVINRRAMVEEMMLKSPWRMKLLWMIFLLKYGTTVCLCHCLIY